MDSKVDHTDLVGLINDEGLISLQIAQSNHFAALHGTGPSVNKGNRFNSANAAAAD